jgi:molecular chaperone DnaK
MKSAIDELEQASQAFSKVLYEANARSGAGAGASATPGDGASKPADEDAIDAEFEVK